MTEHIINHDLYPINNPASKSLQNTIHTAQQTFASNGALQLPDFIQPGIVEHLIAGAQNAKPAAHRMHGEFPPYSDAMDDAADASLPKDHPARLTLPASHLFLPGDLIKPDNPLRTLYEDHSFRQLLQTILDVPQLHPVADNMGNVNLLIYEPGDQNGWHFDTTDFVVSIMLQPATQGGHYQYLPDLRSPKDENLPAIAARMQHPDDKKGVKDCELQPATLFLFKGKYTMHRVTAVEADIDRIIAILSYHPHPGHMISASSKRAMYGRETPIHSNLAF
jgi:hypothetical protein